MTDGKTKNAAVNRANPIRRRQISWKIYRLVTIAISATRTTTATAAAASFHRLGFVDREVATVVVLAVKGVNGALAFFGAAHGDESETAGTVRFAIHDEVGFSDSTMLGKKLVEVLFGGLEGKISYV
jgi:hypothetical protein